MHKSRLKYTHSVIVFPKQLLKRSFYCAHTQILVFKVHNNMVSCPSRSTYRLCQAFLLRYFVKQTSVKHISEIVYVNYKCPSNIAIFWFFPIIWNLFVSTFKVKWKGSFFLFLMNTNSLMKIVENNWLLRLKFPKVNKIPKNRRVDFIL